MQALRGHSVEVPPLVVLTVCWVCGLGGICWAQTQTQLASGCSAAMANTNQMNLVCCGDVDCATGLPRTCSPACAQIFRPVWHLCKSRLYGLPEIQAFAASCGNSAVPAVPASTAQRPPRCPSSSSPQSGHRRAQQDPQSPVCVPEVELLGSVLFSSGSRVVPTEGDGAITLGGLSALSYDPTTQDWFCLSDRNALSGAFYRLRLPTASAGTLTTAADIRFVETIDYHHDDIDAEGLAVCGHGLGQPLYISTEDPPTIARLTREGQATLDAFELPPGFDTSNVRHNKQLESLTCDPSGQLLYTAPEEPLLSDGPIPTVANGGALRIEAIDVRRKTVERTVRYMLEPGEGNGLADLEAIDHDGPQQRLLALERAWTATLGNTIRIFVVDLNEGVDISGCLARDGATVLQCSAEGDAVPKRLLLDLATLDLALDNYEAMAFGPHLADGRRTLLLVNDDNFSRHQIGTQFILLALDLDE